MPPPCVARTPSFLLRWHFVSTPRRRTLPHQRPPPGEGASPLYPAHSSTELNPRTSLCVSLPLAPIKAPARPRHRHSLTAARHYRPSLKRTMAPAPPPHLGPNWHLSDIPLLFPELLDPAAPPLRRRRTPTAAQHQLRPPARMAPPLQTAPHPSKTIYRLLSTLSCSSPTFPSLPRPRFSGFRPARALPAMNFGQGSDCFVLKLPRVFSAKFSNPFSMNFEKS